MTTFALVSFFKFLHGEHICGSPVYYTMKILHLVTTLPSFKSLRPSSASWPPPLLLSMEGQNVGPLVYCIMMTLRLASLSYFLNGEYKFYLPVYHILTTLALALFSSFSIEHMSVDPLFISHNDLRIGLFSPWRT